MYCEEIRPYWLLVTKGYGFTIDMIDWSCPADLEPYHKAYELNIKMQDRQSWQMGIYVQSAVGTAVEHCLAGRKAKSKYIEKPLLEELEEKNKPLTEEEIKRRREKFIGHMMAMSANFRAAKESEVVNEDS